MFNVTWNVYRFTGTNDFPTIIRKSFKFSRKNNKGFAVIVTVNRNDHACRDFGFHKAIISVLH
ncbi:hypothetical protein SAMN02799624_00277 [Paenibacillus sp. UNC496MF]|nr:hypothetical protein SAMN02799624_00277 [Paenibacillus sp. UNC496MF]